MKIALLLASNGGTPLTIGLDRGLRQLGHEVVGYELGQGYDLILACNQAVHRTDYAYPEFPPDSDRTPVAFVDGAEYGWTKRVHEPVDGYWNAFAHGSMAHDTKVPEQQERLRRFLEGRSFPYFLREMWSGWPYPDAYHPIDFPPQFGSTEKSFRPSACR